VKHALGDRREGDRAESALGAPPDRAEKYAPTTAAWSAESVSNARDEPAIVGVAA
jgi:hypothetical protein